MLKCHSLVPVCLLYLLVYIFSDYLTPEHILGFFFLERRCERKGNRRSYEICLIKELEDIKQYSTSLPALHR